MKKYLIPVILILTLISLAFAVEGDIPIGPAAGHDLSGPAPATSDFSIFFPTAAEIPDPKLVMSRDPLKYPDDRVYQTDIGSGTSKRQSAWYRMAITCWRNGGYDTPESEHDKTYAGAIEGAKYDLRINYLPVLKKYVSINLRGADEAVIKSWRQASNQERIIARRNNFVIEVYGIESGKKTAPTRFTRYFAELILKKLADNGY